MTKDLIPKDYARCAGNGMPVCAECLRRKQINVDLEGTDSPWNGWMEPTATEEGCSLAL